METKVHENVQEYMEDPETGSDVDLIVDLGGTNHSELTEKLEEVGGEYLRELSFDFHLVSVPQTELGDFCELSAESIEADEDMEEYDSGKSKSHRVLTL